VFGRSNHLAVERMTPACRDLLFRERTRSTLRRDVRLVSDDDASVADVLAKQIPTELIAPFSLCSSNRRRSREADRKEPASDELAAWRWLAFALLIGSVVAMVWAGKAPKSNSWAFPVLPMSAGVLAAAMWAFITPRSPLVPYLHSRNATTLVPLAFAIAGVAVAPVTAALLTTQPRK